MDILVITFDLGCTSSGIVTDRVCLQLQRKGHNVRVITGKRSDGNRTYASAVASPAPLKPARLYAALGDIVGRDLNYIFWELRAVQSGMAMIRASKPDVIYARGSPGCAFSVGHKLSRSSGVPLAIHFADPIPATLDWEPSRFARRKHLKTILPAQRHAALVTIVNSRMLEHQQETTGERLSEKALILPNPVPDPMSNGPMLEDRFVFTFLGSFLGSRQPDRLLAAFARVAARHSAVDLYIYGEWPKSLARMVMNDPKLRGRVMLEGWTRDVGPIISRSSCLIDIDADSTHPVYTSNKLMDYISVDRPIILISPPGSASNDLVANLARTCVTADTDIESIEIAMEIVVKRKLEDYDFSERQKIRHDLSIAEVTTRLENRLEILKIKNNKFNNLRKQLGTT
jgi:glycosyltransferase involved in cell wall biosynthesis